MTTPSKKPKSEGSFGSFAFGVAVGVGAALLFATEEGRGFASKLLDSLQKNLPVPPKDNPESTPHHAYFEPPKSPIL